MPQASSIVKKISLFPVRLSDHTSRHLPSAPIAMCGVTELAPSMVTRTTVAAAAGRTRKDAESRPRIRPAGMRRRFAATQRAKRVMGVTKGEGEVAFGRLASIQHRQAKEACMKFAYLPGPSLNGSPRIDFPASAVAAP